MRRVVGLCVAFVLAACDSGDASSDPAFLKVEADRARTLLASTAVLYQRVEAATFDLIENCMEAKGFTKHPSRMRSEPLAKLEMPFVKHELPKPRPDIQEPMDEASRRYAMVQNGFPEGVWPPPVQERPQGCVGEALEIVYGPARRSPTVPLVELSDASTKEFGADRRVVTALRQWSQCMASAGYPGLSSPADVSAVTEGGSSLGPNGAVEAAGARCDATHHTTETLAEVWSDVEPRVLARFADRLASYQADLEAQLKRATS
jgi:hypothetical protein